MPRLAGYVTDGLLHVSQMADTFVKDASEMFKVGDSVSVRVLSVDLEKKQVALSRKSENASQDRAPRERKPKADLTEYEGADEKEFITGTVNSIQSCAPLPAETPAAHHSCPRPAAFFVADALCAGARRRRVCDAQGGRRRLDPHLADPGRWR